jgi:hypothetical protein
VARLDLVDKVAYDDHLHAIIRQAVWLYVRFTLSFRNVEDMLAERGLDLSYETVRRWVLKFGPFFAKELRRRRHRPTSRWQLIGGRQFWLWRAVFDPSPADSKRSHRDRHTGHEKPFNAANALIKTGGKVRLGAQPECVETTNSDAGLGFTARVSSHVALGSVYVLIRFIDVDRRPEIAR